MRSRIFKFFLLILISFSIALSGCNNDDDHQHVFIWASDESFHWQRCVGCSLIVNKDVHAARDAFIGSTAAKHWRACPVCLNEFDASFHAYPPLWTIKVPATEEHDGFRERACTICNFTESEIIPRVNHQHSFSADWSSDDTYHWHKAICEHKTERSDRKRHEFGEPDIVLPTLDENGKKIFTCNVCSYIKVEYIPQLDHSHSVGVHHSQVSANCLETGFVEYYDCKKLTCTAKLDKSANVLLSVVAQIDPSNHKLLSSHYESSAEGHWSVKDCCNVIVTEIIPHVWDSGTVVKEPTSIEEGLRRYKCETCAFAKDENIPKIPYNWYETPVDAETLGAVTESTKEVYFGVFPRSVLPLNASIRISDEPVMTMGGNAYYQGSDGEYYERIRENCTIPRSTYSDKSESKLYSEASYRYFKVERIRWRILTRDYKGKKTALLLAAEVQRGDIPFYESISGHRNESKPSNYADSQIRAYLNGISYDSYKSSDEEKWEKKGFLQTAFTRAAQEKIETTSVDNSEESTSDETGTLPKSFACDDTSDKIFLLSEKEATTSSYGFKGYEATDAKRVLQNTDYSIATGAYNVSISAEKGGRWWLRSAYDAVKEWRAVFVSDDGFGADFGDVTNDESGCGVVPALTISLP